MFFALLSTDHLLHNLHLLGYCLSQVSFRLRPDRQLEQSNVPGQRLRLLLQHPKRLRSIRCTGVVSWIAPPIAPNHSTSAPHRSPLTTASTPIS
ncbi:MAG: hypothetical protein HC840_29485 [Leptolyngbyaceae cyanobacterium RM2_2_4]|nr:hypothetical protein [Leptolyngbyaceae cyanobacterium RM2_2_4]